MHEENGGGHPSPGDVVFGHVPDWLDHGFFEKALRVGLGDPGLRISSCEVGAATGKGENYVSIVYAATVTTEGDQELDRRHNLIVKCLPSNKARKVMSNRAEFFRKEVDMYEVVFPEYGRLSRIGPGVLPWPRHLWSIFDGEQDVIILEDLRVAGYVMQDRLSGLDADHLDVALRALARFHAFSYALKLREPEVFREKVYDLFPETMFSHKTKDMIDPFVRNAFRDTALVIREWADAKYDAIADWVDATKEDAATNMIRLLSRDDPGAVLNHGDFWINNMLFRYSSDGGPPVDDVKLLDFQISRVCSPAGDISYLMATSITAPVRKAHFDTLLKTAYLETLWDTLGALGARDLAESQTGLYTWPWLQAEIARYRPFAFVTALTTTQVILAETSDAPDMDSMTEEQLNGAVEKNPFSDLCKGKLYQVRLRGLLDEFLEEGMFSP